MESLRFEYERQISTMAKRIQQLEISLEVLLVLQSCILLCVNIYIYIGFG
jgi:lipopolysaccharide/colanic/teichoic acid biosynthesis glycosyltransferase